MKKAISIIWIMVLMTFSITAQTSKTVKAKQGTKVSVNATKVKSANTWNSASMQAIPANAFYFKDNGNQDAKIDSKYPAIVIEGSNNRITIADGNSMIFIKGKKNDINMISADYIEITGDDNFVSWEVSNNATGKPVIKDKGGYNNVGKRSTGAINKSEN